MSVVINSQLTPPRLCSCLWLCVCLFLSVPLFCSVCVSAGFCLFCWGQTTTAPFPFKDECLRPTHTVSYWSSLYLHRLCGMRLRLWWKLKENKTTFSHVWLMHTPVLRLSRGSQLVYDQNFVFRELRIPVNTVLSAFRKLNICQITSPSLEWEKSLVVKERRKRNVGVWIHVHVSVGGEDCFHW